MASALLIHGRDATTGTTGTFVMDCEHQVIKLRVHNVYGNSPVSCLLRDSSNNVLHPLTIIAGDIQPHIIKFNAGLIYDLFYVKATNDTVQFTVWT